MNGTFTRIWLVIVMLDDRFWKQTKHHLNMAHINKWNILSKQAHKHICIKVPKLEQTTMDHGFNKIDVN